MCSEFLSKTYVQMDTHVLIVPQKLGVCEDTCTPKAEGNDVKNHKS